MYFVHIAELYMCRVAEQPIANPGAQSSTALSSRWAGHIIGETVPVESIDMTTSKQRKNFDAQSIIRQLSEEEAGETLKEIFDASERTDLTAKEFRALCYQILGETQEMTVSDGP